MLYIGIGVASGVLGCFTAAWYAPYSRLVRLVILFVTAVIVVDAVVGFDLLRRWAEADGNRSWTITVIGITAAFLYGYIEALAEGRRGMVSKPIRDDRPVAKMPSNRRSFVNASTFPERPKTQRKQTRAQRKASGYIRPRPKVKGGAA